MSPYITHDEPKKARRRTRIAPSPQYLEVLAILDRGDFPTPKLVLDLLWHDQVVSFVRARVQDWIYWRLDRVGLLPGASRLRIAFDDDFSIGLESVEAEALAEIRSRYPARRYEPEA